jgi:hypothetical protein
MSDINAFYDFVKDGTGNTSIRTSFGQREQGGCDCRLPSNGGSWTHMSRLARFEQIQQDDDDDVPYCLTTYASAEDSSSTLDAHQHQLHAGHDDDALTMWQHSKCVMPVSGEHEGPLSGDEEDLITECLTPQRKSPDHPSRTMFVLGDSHASVMQPALLHAARGTFQIRLLYTDSVGLFPHRTEGVANPGRFVDVYEHVLMTLRHQITHGDAVVISMWSGNWASELGAISKGTKGGVRDRESSPLKSMETDLLRGIVEPANAKLIVFGDWPYFGDKAYFGQPPSGNPSKTEADMKAQAKLHSEITPMLSHHTSLRYMSLLPLFCDGETEFITLFKTNSTKSLRGRCSWNIPGTSIQAYSDSEHLNTAGSIYMWPYICDENLW